MLGVELYEDEAGTQPTREIKLGPTILSDGSAGYGDPQRLYLKNISTVSLMAANINLDGEGADSIQLARDENGAHGIWAQPGQGIIALAREVKPGETFAFWARAAFTEEDAPERVDFRFQIEVVGRNA